ncbi:hypothetical protein PoB_006223200 [Plakobranchus ocellatus]|uniref:Uncharacterized protein n=1 Tax=Plakobranchus ocellatus TaxID=259542 RepID=A0AAV4CUY8_9GAST|nr:hypothetical protein PoB_006223200 [Plakobranchus ocellatus]
MLELKWRGDLRIVEYSGLRKKKLSTNPKTLQNMGVLSSMKNKSRPPISMSKSSAVTLTNFCVALGKRLQKRTEHTSNQKHNTVWAVHIPSTYLKIFKALYDKLKGQSRSLQEIKPCKCATLEPPTTSTFLFKSIYLSTTEHC